MCKSILESNSEATANIREAAMDSCSIVVRSYLAPSDRADKFLDIINRMAQLQKHYKIFLRYSQLAHSNVDALTECLKCYMSTEPAKDFADIVSMGNLLGMEKPLICKLALEHVNYDPRVLQAAIS